MFHFDRLSMELQILLEFFIYLVRWLLLAGSIVSGYTSHLLLLRLYGVHSFRKKKTDKTETKRFYEPTQNM